MHIPPNSQPRHDDMNRAPTNIYEIFNHLGDIYTRVDKNDWARTRAMCERVCDASKLLDGTGSDEIHQHAISLIDKTLVKLNAMSDSSDVVESRALLSLARDEIEPFTETDE